MANARRIKVKGVRRTDGEDVEMLSLVLWLQAKRVLRQRRLDAEAAKRKARRREIEGDRER
jgi:hypothetical protein